MNKIKNIIKKYYYVLVIVLAVIIVAIIWTNDGNKEITLKMKVADDSYKSQGYEEFSTNLDTESLPALRSSLVTSGIGMSDEDFAAITSNLQKCDREKDDQVNYKLDSAMSYSGAIVDTKVIVEWDGTIGSILRIYAKDKSFIDKMNETTLDI